LEEKEKWDPDFAKRKKIKAIVDNFIPEFSVRNRGLDIYRHYKPGIDKAYGIRKLRDLLGISIKEMIYIGDALYVAAMITLLKQREWIASRLRIPARRSGSFKPSSPV